MKLVLDSKYEWARKIAKCFIGSVLRQIGEYNPIYEYLTSVYERKYNTFVFGIHQSDGTSYTEDSITIDLETAKFDPFAAMREGVKMATHIDYSAINESGYLLSFSWGEIDDECKNTHIYIDWCRTIEGVEVIDV